MANEYRVLINSQDFSDVIALDNGYFWSVTSHSAQSSTGQDTTGAFHIPVLGERVQLVFTAPSYITKERMTAFVAALEMGTKGQRDVAITYHDPLFGEITHDFYCTNVPWLKERLPDYPHNYISGVKVQLASTRFMGRQVVTDSPKIPPIFNLEPQYEYKINGAEFNDIIAINGFKGQIIEQSLESQTGLTLDGRFHLPIIGSRAQHEIEAVEYLEVGRFRQLGKALGFGKTGERVANITYVDEIFGKTTQPFYCTEISGHVEKTPDYPHHYIRGVKFQVAMKKFF